MPTVEGLTPTILWYTLIGIVGIFSVYLIFHKVVESIRSDIERKKQKAAEHEPTLADAISKKVTDSLEPRFKKIEENLGKDKNRLDLHETMITNIQNAQADMHNGLSVLCSAMIVVLNSNGKSPEIISAIDALNTYLAKRI